MIELMLMLCFILLFITAITMLGFVSALFVALASSLLDYFSKNKIN